MLWAEQHIANRLNCQHVITSLSLLSIMWIVNTSDHTNENSHEIYIQRKDITQSFILWIQILLIMTMMLNMYILYHTFELFESFLACLGGLWFYILYLISLFSPFPRLLPFRTHTQRGLSQNIRRAYQITILNKYKSSASNSDLSLI